MGGKLENSKMANKSFNLNNKVSLITGAGGLLGYEHASALIESDSIIVLTGMFSFMAAL